MSKPTPKGTRPNPSEKEVLIKVFEELIASHELLGRLTTKLLENSKLINEKHKKETEDSGFAYIYDKSPLPKFALVPIGGTALNPAARGNLIKFYKQALVVLEMQDASSH